MSFLLFEALYQPVTYIWRLVVQWLSEYEAEEVAYVSLPCKFLYGYNPSMQENELERSPTSRAAFATGWDTVSKHQTNHVNNKTVVSLAI